MEFRILGPLEVVHEGRSVALPGGRERAILALLLLSANQVVSTERIIEDLWADDPPEGANPALRVFVSRLRKALREAWAGDVVVTQAPGYLVRVEPGALDAVRFAALVEQGRAQSAAGDHSSAAATLREALGLWRGPALADVADAPFARAEAARLEEERLASLEARVDADLACGRHRQLVAELEGHTSAHPLRERFWAQRMTALYRADRQAEALAVFQQLRRTLGEELGLEPSASLRQLETAILRQAPELGWRPPAERLGTFQFSAGEAPAGAGVAFAGRTPFVGRAGERAKLSAALSRALKGSGGLLLIGGEPGIGKTRLAEETASEATGRGLAVLSGHSYEMAGASPYVPFVEIVEAALAGADSPDAFRDQVLGDAAPEVARLVPRLRRLFPDLPPPLDLPPEQERRYLFTCLGDVFGRLAAARPTLVVLDDLQWADEPTLLFLEHLAPQLPGLALLVVGTYRDVEVGRPLALTFEDLHRRRLAERLELGGMTEAETGEVVRALAGQEPPAPLVEGLHAETEGNPFFLEEVFRHLAEEGRLFDADGRFRSDTDLAALDVPEGVRLVIGRRLERLSADAQRLLAAAAVAGRVFSFRLLQALADLGPDGVLDVVDEAERAMLVRERRGEEEFLFAHELIRQTLVASLSSPRRRRAHLRAAQAMIEVWAERLGEQAAQIAHHLVEAGEEADPGQVLTYSLLAGQRALDTSAYEEALAHLERAAELEAVAAPRQRAELFFALGSANRRLGHWEAAVAAWQRSMEEYEALGDHEAVGRTCLEVGFNLAWANRITESVATYQRGLAALAEKVSADRARLLARLSVPLSYGGDPVAGDAMLAEALQLTDELGDEALRGFVLGEKSCALQASMRLVDLAAAGVEGAEIMRASGDLWGTATALGFVEMSLVHCGRFADAITVGDELLPLAERIGNYPALFVHGRARGILEFARHGDLDALDEFCRWDVDFSQRTIVAFIGHAYSWLGLAAFLRGDWEAAGGWFERGAAQPPPVLPGFCWGSWFRYLAAAGRRDEALAFFEEKQPLLPVPGRPNTWTAWTLLTAFTEGLYILGERERPAAWYPLLVEASGTGVVLTSYFEGRLLERVAGMAAAAGQDWEVAERHFQLALHQADELPHQLERLETRHFYAEMLAERDGPGDLDRARTLLEEAVDGFTRLRMPRHAEMTRASLLSLRSSSSR